MDKAVETDEALIEEAAAAVRRALVQLFDGREAVAAVNEKALAAMTPAEQDEAMRREEEVCQAHPDLAALHLCLTSSAHLLEAGRLLVSRRRSTSLADKASRGRHLVEQIKIAGRAAYRAALILSEHAVHGRAR